MSSRDDISESFLSSDLVNDDFFISIVETKSKISRDDFKLRVVLLEPAIGRNENYLSIVYRVKIKFVLKSTKELKSEDVIMKVISVSEMKEFKVHPRETLFYEKVIDKFENIWKDLTAENVRFGPRSIKSVNEPFEVLVLDDLKPENYEMMERRSGLNVKQSKMFLSKLAKFHAISALLYLQEGKIDIIFDRKESNPPLDLESPFIKCFDNILKNFVNVLYAQDDLKIYADKISKWDTTCMFSLFTDIAEPMRCGFLCLCHGDCWSNNMLFKLDENRSALDVLMIDFQALFWASPASDLAYFMISSVSDDVKVDHFDDFIEYYQQELASSLEKLKYPQHIPTLSDVHLDLLEKGSFAAMCLVFIMFIVRFDGGDEMNINALMAADAAFLNRVYSNENYLKALRSWLPFMNKRGFLDCLMKRD